MEPSYPASSSKSLRPISTVTRRASAHRRSTVIASGQQRSDDCDDFARTGNQRGQVWGSVVNGRVEVKWSLAADNRLMLTWTERGGPAVNKPTRQGFGTRLMERMIRDQQNGDLRLDWSAEGLACEIILPL
jgi:hypothetical protein